VNLNQTVTVVRAAPGGRDRYGDPVDGDVVEFDLSHVAVAPRGSSDVSDRARTGVIVGATLYAPAADPPHDVRSTDRIRWRGVMFDVEGDVGVWVSPWTGQVRGVEVALRRAEG
jgi:hypothetical protein